MKFAENEKLFRQTFKPGTYVRSMFKLGYSYSTCLFIMGEIFKDAEGHIYTIAPKGLNCSRKEYYNEKFGIEDNEITLMTPEEIKYFNLRFPESVVIYNTNELPELLHQMADYLAENFDMTYVREMVESGLFHDAIGKVVNYNGDKVYVTTEY